MNEMPANKIRVLLVDDDKGNLLLLKNILAKQGHFVTTAKNGLEAVDLLRKKEEFDICFMDILMPVLNGVAATLIIRQEINHNMPIIAMTSSNMKSTRDACYDVGMNDFIAKPINSGELSDVISLYTNHYAATRTTPVFNQAIFPRNF